MKDEAPFNISSSGFAIQIGDWQEQGITGGEFEIPLPKEWVAGAEVPISIVENLMDGVGGDLFTGKKFDVWEEGTLLINEVGLDKPLILHIGESVAYVDDDSWATFKVSPQSGRLPYLQKAKVALADLSTRLQEFKRDLEGRKIQENWMFPYRCGLDFPWKLKSDGSGERISFNAVELYFVRCSVHVVPAYASQAEGLATIVKSSEEYQETYGKSRLVKGLESVAIAIEELASTYRREGSYLGNQSGFEKALVYITSSSDAVDEAIASAIKIHDENYQKLRNDSSQLTLEWRKFCVEDGKNCK